MPSEERRDVGPKTRRVTSDISRGGPLLVRSPQIETRRTIRSHGPPWKKGVLQQLLLIPPSPLPSSFSLFLPLRSPSTSFDLFPCKREFPQLYSLSANNREHVISYSAYHTHYHQFFGSWPGGIYCREMSVRGAVVCDPIRAQACIVRCLLYVKHI